MPRVISYTPGWLSRPSPGFDLFSSQPGDGELSRKAAPKSINGPSRRAPYLGSHRILATRGTEVFVVVGNTIRWADLSLLKYEWESRSEHRRSLGRSHNQSQSTEDDAFDGVKHKTLKVPVHEQIQQLITSPNNDLLAIVTSHTVHIAVLPDSSHLDQPDSGPLKLKTHTLGPTIHVLSQSRVVGVLWHPLGASGSCIVTVTADAVVRLWELNKENRWSYSQPAVDIDLTKLHHAKSAEYNVQSVRIGDSRGYSLDTLGMEVAAATFGGSGSETEQGWSPMTLWVAMTEGDVYALSPLLPSRWRSPTNLIPSLTTSVVAKKAYAEGPDIDAEERRVFDYQYRWLKELDEQEPLLEAGRDEFGPKAAIYNKPKAEEFVPKLQGPFRILPGDVEDDLELAGILVVAPKLHTEDLFGLDDEDALEDTETGGLSTTVVCLVTRSGRIYICLNLEEVEGQWLPLTKAEIHQANPSASQPELVLLEALDTLKSEDATEDEWPMFTLDIRSRYSFYVTHSHGIFFLSLEPWLESLESELRSEDSAGTGFRMEIFAKGSHTLRERIARFDPIPGLHEGSLVIACVLFQDSDLGYFLLSSQNERPHAVVLDSPETKHVDKIKRESGSPEYEPEIKMIPAPPRPLFEPPGIFWTHKTALSTFLDSHVNKRNRLMLKEEVRLSSATLEVMTEAHRVLSLESQLLGSAAAEVFRRCERLQEELRDQIRRVNELASRIEKLNGDDADDLSADDDEEEESQSDYRRARGSERIEIRLRTAMQRTGNITDKCEALRRKLGRLGGRPLSQKEAVYTKEVDKYGDALLEPAKKAEGKEDGGKGEGDEEDGDGQDEMDESEDYEPAKKVADEGPEKPWQRLENLQALVSELTTEAKEAAGEEDNSATASAMAASATGGAGSSSFKIPPDIRKTRLAQVMSLLERESALVDAAQDRLGRLSLTSAG